MSLVACVLVGLLAAPGPTTVLFEATISGVPSTEADATRQALEAALSARLLGPLVVAPASATPKRSALARGATQYVRVRIQPRGDRLEVRAGLHSVDRDTASQVRLLASRGGLAASMPALAQSLLATADPDAVTGLLTHSDGAVRLTPVPAIGGIIHRDRGTPSKPRVHRVAVELVRDRRTTAAAVRYATTRAGMARPLFAVAFAPIHTPSLSLDGGIASIYRSGARLDLGVRLRHWFSQETTAFGLLLRGSARLGAAPALDLGLSLTAYQALSLDDPPEEASPYELGVFAGVPW